MGFAQGIHVTVLRLLVKRDGLAPLLETELISLGYSVSGLYLTKRRGRNASGTMSSGVVEQTTSQGVARCHTSCPAPIYLK